MLRATDPLPLRPRRVVVAGVSGSGKTTLAGRISEALGIPHTEIDALYHGPNWKPRAEFDDDVRQLVAGDAWVTEWQYSSARPLLAERAELLVWLDPPYRQTLWRVVRRTARRRARRERLWNGNVEPPFWRSLLDPEGIIRWSIATRHKYAAQVPQALTDHPHLVAVRLRSQREVEVWLGRLRG